MRECRVKQYGHQRPAQERGERPGVIWAVLGLCGLLGWCGYADAESAVTAATGADGTRVISVNTSLWSKGGGEADASLDNRGQLQREGLVIDYRARSLEPLRKPSEILENDQVEISLKLQDEQGNPLRGIYPAVWIDYDKTAPDQQPSAMACKDRVGMYLAGNVGIRPMIDLNSYFLLVMNQEPNISVIDPIIGVGGRTKLFTQVPLDQPGGDWVGTADGKRLFVSMPKADAVAVIDTENFKLITNLDAGTQPLRVALQPDEQHLWVANNGEGSASGITVFEVASMQQRAQFSTGAGHHEIAFSADGGKAYVSNRDAGSVSVIDTQTLQPIQTLQIGGVPVAMGYSGLADALYVSDGKSGQVVVIDGREQVIARIQAEPGLGPLGFSPDGRWGVLTNPFTDQVSIIDASTNQIAHNIKVEGKPYQVSFSRAFAYIRSLESERVSMLELQHFDADTPPLVTFPAGTKAPGLVRDPSIASQVVQAPGEAAVLVVSPADATVYYYMEGMNAPMGNFRNYGQTPRAVTVVDRTLREQQPGVYSAKLKIPLAGAYKVAMVLESPQVLHCFDLVANPDPLLAAEQETLAVQYLGDSRRVAAGKPVVLEFRLSNKIGKQPRTDLKQVKVLYYRAPGAQRRETVAEHRGDGVYRVDLEVPKRGAYYVYVGVPEAQLDYGALPYRTLRAQ